MNWWQRRLARYVARMLGEKCRLVYASELGEKDGWDSSLRETLELYERLYNVKFVIVDRALAQEMRREERDADGNRLQASLFDHVER